jgi:hypothetical protein
MADEDLERRLERIESRAMRADERVDYLVSVLEALTLHLAATLTQRHDERALRAAVLEIRDRLGQI